MRMLQHAHSSPGVLLMAIGADVLHVLTVYWIGRDARRSAQYPATAGERNTVGLSGRTTAPQISTLERHTRKQIRP